MIRSILVMKGIAKASVDNRANHVIVENMENTGAFSLFGIGDNF